MYNCINNDRARSLGYGKSPSPWRRTSSRRLANFVPLMPQRASNAKYKLPPVCGSPSRWVTSRPPDCMGFFSFGIPPDQISSVILKRTARRHYHRSGKHLKHVICCVETSHSFRNSRVLCDCSLQSQIAKGQPRRNVTCRSRQVNRITSQYAKSRKTLS
jgi:hypothetical protein